MDPGQLQNIDDGGDQMRNRNPLLLLFCHFSFVIIRMRARISLATYKLDGKSANL
jgi:hypothetical protein